MINLPGKQNDLKRLRLSIYFPSISQHDYHHSCSGCCRSCWSRWIVGSETLLHSWLAPSSTNFPLMSTTAPMLQPVAEQFVLECFFHSWLAPSTTYFPFSTSQHDCHHCCSRLLLLLQKLLKSLSSLFWKASSLFAGTELHLQRRLSMWFHDHRNPTICCEHGGKSYSMGEVCSSFMFRLKLWSLSLFLRFIIFVMYNFCSIQT